VAGIWSSLQARLIGAFLLVTLVALALAATVFVVLSKEDQERQAIDRVVAASPVIYSSFYALQAYEDFDVLVDDFVDLAAREHDVRIIVLDSSTGVVNADSAGAWQGRALALPRDFRARQDRAGAFQPFAFQVENGLGEDLYMVSSAIPRYGRFGGLQGGDRGPFADPQEEQGLSLVLAVPEATISRAWRELLPGLALAAAFALPAAVGLAVVVSRYITRPLHELTVASQQMARGSFDVEISTQRSDEVGRLAQAFSVMAGRLGEAHTQMRSLVSGVSHDLKTPLTSILGFSQALRDGAVDDEAERQRLSTVLYEEAARLNTRLNDLLLLSELDSGQALLQTEAIDLGALASSTAGRLAPGLEERSLRVASELQPGVTASVDVPKMERAFENLLDNARKYAPAGSEVRLRAWQEPGVAAYSVENEAPDLEPDEVPRLFERFYRRNRARTTAENGSSGSGLGLPIARDIVQLHGGTLDATLEGGRLRFTVRLPAGEMRGGLRWEQPA
jgi:signal transduction histidine kinase